MCKNFRRAGLSVPILKLGQLDVVCVFHRFEPVVGGSSLPIMTLEVEFNPPFGTLFRQGLCGAFG